MGLSEPRRPLRAAPEHPRPAHRQAGRRGRSVFRRPQQRARRQGLPRHRGRRPDHLGAHRLADVDDVRARLLRRRDDADVDAALRRRALRLRAARLAAPVRRDDRRRHADQQDGAGAAQGLRPDAGAALRHLDGLVRQWRRLLPLFLFGGARLRPHRAGRHLRAGLPADRGGAALRRAAAAEEDPPHRRRSNAEHGRDARYARQDHRWRACRVGDRPCGRASAS